MMKKKKKVGTTYIQFILYKEDTVLNNVGDSKARFIWSHRICNGFCWKNGKYLKHSISAHSCQLLPKASDGAQVSHGRPCRERPI